MSILRDLFRKKDVYFPNETAWEYCTNCDADLTKQKGFNADSLYWVCKGCGQMLIRPDFDWDVIWRCDKCGNLLNVQEGFSEDCGEWACRKCGTVNPINKSGLYSSEAEYFSDASDLYYGLSDEATLELSAYAWIQDLNDGGNVRIVRHADTGKVYVEKILRQYDSSVYMYLMEHPVPHMPCIEAVYEGRDRLIVIEEYIHAATLADVLRDARLNMECAAEIAAKICEILDDLHNLPIPIIHRDVKPSNIMYSADGEVYLLDMNASKWYKEDETDDTKYIGTMGYAAPEQAGFGLSASSAKTDIYALGILMNVMATGHYPKEEKAPSPLYSVIERCTRLNAEERLSAAEVIDALKETGLI